MGQQRGTFYWDDDSLSPGNRSDGGWSQNLYDQNGHLREHGTFFPDLDSDESDSTYSPYGDPPMFMSSETRLESDDEDDVESEEGTADGFAILLTIVGAAAVAGAAYAAAPPLKKWASNTAIPFIKGAFSKVRMPWGKKQDEDLAPEGTDVASSPLAVIGHDGAGATHTPLQIEAKREKMSNAEAQARLVAAAAAQRFAMEQANLVSQSDIVGAADVNEVMQQIDEHPQEMLDTLIKQLAHNPRLLEDGSLAQLASILDRNSLGLDAAQQECASLPHTSGGTDNR